MLDLAMHRGRPLVPIQEIAARQAIPQRYLEQVLLSLKRAGLLTSKRGSTGGDHLTKSPDEITAGAVLGAVGGSGGALGAGGGGGQRRAVRRWPAGPAARELRWGTGRAVGRDRRGRGRRRRS